MEKNVEMSSRVEQLTHTSSNTVKTVVLTVFIVLTVILAGAIGLLVWFIFKREKELEDTKAMLKSALLIKQADIMPKQGAPVQITSVPTTPPSMTETIAQTVTNPTTSQLPPQPSPYVI